MNIREQEIFLRLTLKWIIQNYFFFKYRIEPYDWREVASREFKDICLGQVYDNFYGSVEDIFSVGQANYIQIHDVRIWMMLYEQWCEARLNEAPSDNSPITMDQKVVEKYVTERGWSLEVGATLIHTVEKNTWWGWREGNFSQAMRLSDLTRMLLRKEYPQFSIR